MSKTAAKTSPSLPRVIEHLLAAKKPYSYPGNVTCGGITRARKSGPTSRITQQGQVKMNGGTMYIAISNLTSSARSSLIACGLLSHSLTSGAKTNDPQHR